MTTPPGSLEDRGKESCQNRQPTNPSSQESGSLKKVTGNFARERVFFEQFQPFIFATNLVTLKLNRYYWSFMGFGSILLRDELDLRTYSFGSIQGGTAPNLFAEPHDQSKAGMLIANEYLGTDQENPVAGISEIGSLIISAQHHPKQLIEILNSVAKRGEDKFLRKYLMIEGVTKLLGLPIQLPPRPPVNPHSIWGSFYATDLSSLYLIKILGADTINDSYNGGLPEEAISRLEDIPMTFMERFNTQAYNGVQREVRADWFSGLVRNGIEPYERQDWIDLEAILKLMNDTRKPHR